MAVLRPRFWLCMLALVLPLGESQRLGAAMSVVKLVVGLVILSGLAWLAVRGRAVRRTPIDIPLLVFVSALLPSFLLSRDTDGMLVVFIAFVGYFILNLVVTNFASDGVALRQIAVAVTVGVAATALFGIVQFTTGETFLQQATGREALYKWDLPSEEDLPGQEAVRTYRVLGTARNPSTFAANFVLGLPILLGLYLASHRRWQQTMLLSAFLLGGITLVLTFSRGGLVAALAGVSVTTLIGAGRRGGWRRTALILALVAGGLLALGASQVAYYALPFNRLGEDVSARERLLVIRPAIQIFLDHPLVGIGFLESTRMLARYREDVLEGMNIHNDFLAIATELGLFGLVPFLAVLVIAVRHGVRAARRAPDPDLRGLAAGFLGGLVGLLGMGASHMQYMNVGLWFAMSLTLAVATAARNGAAGWRRSRVSA